MLYLGSQVENFRFFNDSPEKHTQNETEEINKIKDSFQMLKENLTRNNQNAAQNSALISSDNSNSCEGNSTNYITAVSTTFHGPPKDSNVNGDAIHMNGKFLISNDLLTDDEKENNLSY